LPLLDQALAPRAGLLQKEQWVRPGESAFARWAITCMDGGCFSGKPISAG
jgi:hypothetical protein